ncbi:2-phospho-L-lactate transferase [Rathayibacter toxicus]|uniref:2-phospho-L-lactate transferase n=1 Tax=Rathayibacter toxicus TaxID=145458 RepID=A0A0C5BJA3_9MICO|nr:2-phospho-L-lactate transferase [Rathayibacter toxicus]AJM78390.1 2-phospho-L-lactate transferase [Rathayibacter toxicus]ALS58195.1 2-phospho-L-lactate transferase [Rathayibacter toxicus]KKM44794.1 2-phospho-L-lactate transferase [Rathayibacter toxicus]PPG21937.1 2-phospho-L-lactate transferase [Rathayibacter toxicus]PPG46899.1 2-phospho-L-lactate transferase [Rathayibacter toxicus]
MRITILAGGVGGARFAVAIREHLRDLEATGAGPSDIIVIVNTGDDLWLAGLKVCPDLDSLTYALAGVNDPQRGWGRAGESERVSAELAAFGVGWPWFTLGDLDLATHIARTSLLRDGRTLSEATQGITARWPLGVQLLPMSDQEVPTQVEVELPGDGIRTVHFEEWWVRYGARLPARRFLQHSIERAQPAPGVLAAIADADAVLIAPSNPVVSIGTILGVPDIADAVRTTSAAVVGVSPIIGGAAVRGMADQCLTAVGVETSAKAVGRHYGARSSGGLLDSWLIDEQDAADVPALTAAGLRVHAVPLWFRDRASSMRLAADAVAAAGLDGRFRPGTGRIL